MMSFEKIKECIESKRFMIINVIKSNNYQFDKETGKEQSFFTEIMDEVEINLFFLKLEQIIKGKNSLCFVILNEYFFSYHLVISKKNYDFIINMCKEISKKKPNIILYINLCHETEKNNLPAEYSKKLKIYLNDIYDNDNNQIWKISSLEYSKLFKEKINNYFANETFAIMNGYILYSYKKSSYYEEIENISNYNYIIGFGTDEINQDLNNELKEISKYLSEKISIEICFDFQRNIKTKSFENIILEKGDPKLNAIEELKELRKDVKNYSEKKLIIIQSNITNLYEQIDLLPPEVIICKCDPLQSLVFIIKDKNNINEIKYIETHYSDLINHEKNKGLLQINKGKRLNRALNEFKKKCEFLNVSKLIKEFESQKSEANIGNHHYIFFEYNI